MTDGNDDDSAKEVVNAGDQPAMVLPSSRRHSRVSLHSVIKETTFPHRQRSSSNASEDSLSNTMDFYGINRKPPLRRTTSALSNSPSEPDNASRNTFEPVALIHPSEPTSSAPNTSTHLFAPSASVYNNPRASSRASNLSIPGFTSPVPGFASPVPVFASPSLLSRPTSPSPSWFASTGEVTPEFPRRVGKGPLITRVASPFAAGRATSLPLVARDPKIGKIPQDVQVNGTKKNDPEGNQFDVMQFVMQDEQAAERTVKKTSPFPVHRKAQPERRYPISAPSPSFEEDLGANHVFASHAQPGKGFGGLLTEARMENRRPDSVDGKILSIDSKQTELKRDDEGKPEENREKYPDRANHISISLIPAVDDKGHKLRNYQTYGGNNRFFLNGRLLTSGDNPLPFILSLVAAIALPVMFLGFSGPFLWHRLGEGGKASLFIFAWLTAIMWTNMCVTAWRDPGIVPRNLDKSPQRKWVEDLHGDGSGGWRAEPRYRKIKEGVIACKWCETCETYRPPRTSHCRLCNNCVDHTDHHCTYLNNCIGRRNYTSFFAFLVFSAITGIYAIAFSGWHISQRHKDSQDTSGTGWSKRSDVVGSFVVIIFTFFLLVPILGLLTYHFSLVWNNRTTIEMLRPKDERSGVINPATGRALGNVYSLSSPFRNIFSILCGPMQADSSIQPMAYVMNDARKD